jgi:hypothetical protein
VSESLSLEGRRGVNLAVIACAEWLYERLAPGGLADLARQTTLRRVFESSYGSPEQCEALLGAVARALGEFERQAEDLVDIKARTDRLRRVAAYRAESDTIPTPGSVHAAERSPQGGVPAANLLLEEYFDIYRVLLR